MTKKTLQLLATVAAVAGMSLATVTANADDTVKSGTQTTTAKVSLTAGSDTSTDGNGNGDAGGIKLTNVPNIDFGTQELDGKTAFNLDGKLSGNNEAASQAVTVVNPGIGTGWNVQVRNDAMKSASDTTLMASTISLTAKDATPGAGSADTNSTRASDSTAELSAEPTFVSTALNTQGSENQKVAAAAVGGGLGTWNMNYSKANLQVNPRNVAGDYSTTLTWTITNAPAGLGASQSDQTSAY